jgi:hypothetical protein
MQDSIQATQNIRGVQAELVMVTRVEELAKLGESA